MPTQTDGPTRGQIVIFAASGLLLLILLIVGGSYGHYFLYRDLAPRFENTERQVFEQTPSFVHGKITFLSRLRREYKTAEAAGERANIKELILTEAASVDLSKLPADLRDFIKSLD